MSFKILNNCIFHFQKFPFIFKSTYSFLTVFCYLLIFSTASIISLNIFNTAALYSITDNSDNLSLFWGGGSKSVHFFCWFSFIMAYLPMCRVTFDCEWLLNLQTELLKISSRDNCFRFCSCSCWISQAQIPHLLTRPRPNILVALWLLTSDSCFHCPLIYWLLYLWKEGPWRLLLLLMRPEMAQRVCPWEPHYQKQKSDCDGLHDVDSVKLELCYPQIVSFCGCGFEFTKRNLYEIYKAEWSNGHYSLKVVVVRHADRNTQMCPAGWSLPLLSPVPCPVFLPITHPVDSQQPHTYDQIHK